MAVHVEPSSRLRPIIAAIRSVPHPPGRTKDESQAVEAVPFVTISRQAGAGGLTLADRLVERLNGGHHKGPKWSGVDRELVEKIAADRRISRALIESLDESTYSWLEDLWAGLSFAGGRERPGEAEIYRQVIAAVRAMASVGHVVIVGRGGVFITQNMPGGIHIRLIAPLEHRIRWFAHRYNLDDKSAAERIRRIDRNREAFYRRYWPGKGLECHRFTMTLNTALIEERHLIDCIEPLIA
jgi:hypothetical protein